MCSPNITPITKNGKTTFILTINSWGDKSGEPDQLFYMTSTDVVTWSYPPKPLAPEVTKGVRAIDAAIAFANEKYYLIWKSTSDWIPLVAVSHDLDKDWKLLGSPTFERKPSERLHENFEFIQVDKKWRLLSTDNLLPFFYNMNGTGENDQDWLSWTNGYELQVEKKVWNSEGLANAAAIADWREYDGYFYLFFCWRKRYRYFSWKRTRKIRSIQV